MGNVIRKNRSGMTLIEVMIASVVALIVGLAFAEMNSQQARMQKRLQIKSEAQNFHNYVRFLVINTAAETVNQN
jgi:prepilin-type N-terminal cleavage/methylation domain-containing protein